MSAKQKDVASSAAHDQKFFVQAFFGLVRLFFRIFFIKCLQRVPPSFFPYFAKEWMFKNSQRPPFDIFRHYATYRRPKKSKKKIQKKFDFFFNFFLTRVL